VCVCVCVCVSSSQLRHRIIMYSSLEDHDMNLHGRENLMSRIFFLIISAVHRPSFQQTVGSFMSTCCILYRTSKSHCHRIVCFLWSRGSSVVIATRLCAGRSGFDSWLWLGIFLFATVFGAHPASYPMRTGGSFPGGKAAGEWIWPLTSIYCRGQRMSGAILSLPQYVFMAWCLVKHSDNFTFTFVFASYAYVFSV
jgi:hypothetical protein